MVIGMVIGLRTHDAALDDGVVLVKKVVVISVLKLKSSVPCPTTGETTLSTINVLRMVTALDTGMIANCYTDNSTNDNMAYQPLRSRLHTAAVISARFEWSSHSARLFVDGIQPRDHLLVRCNVLQFIQRIGLSHWCEDRRLSESVNDHPNCVIALRRLRKLRDKIHRDVVPLPFGNLRLY
ncbi:hypothetical protein Tco_0158075 [Tanacetum coccineum]